MKKERKSEIMWNLLKHRIGGMHVRDFEPENIRNKVENMVKTKEFSEFSKEEILEVVKGIALEKLEEITKGLEDLKLDEEKRKVGFR